MMEVEEKETLGLGMRKEETEADSDDVPCAYSVGQLAWARVGNAPFWPCTFTYDPDLKIHSYITRTGGSEEVRCHRQVGY